MKFEITIPCYNEEHRLEAGFKVLCDRLCRETRHAVSIVFSDNGSSDATPEIAQRLVAASPVPARYLRIENAGLAMALRAAWDSSNADVVGYCDADMATDVSHLDEVFALFENPGVVVVNGSRWLPRSIVSGRNFRRKLFSLMLRTAVRVFTGIRASDVACGFKFFRRDWYASKSKNLFSEKFFLGAELLAKAEHSGVRIVEIPVRWQERPGSRIRIIPTIVAYWREAMKLRTALRSGA